MTKGEPRQARVFALTGGIGSGKSSVAAILAESGIPVVDADDLARKAVEVGSVGLQAVIDAFGEGILNAHGALDRPRLGALVFRDKDARNHLESIVHPIVRMAAEQTFAELSGAGHRLICYEIPLLFETGQESRFRPIVLVAVSPETQLIRVMNRDGISRQQAQVRIDAQLPLEEKRARADYCIDNDADLDSLRKKTLSIVKLVSSLC